MFKRVNPRALYPSIVVLLSVVAIACTSGDGQDPPPAASSLLEGVETNIELTSVEFSDGGEIPGVYTCYGLDTSPPVSWSSVPDGTLSLALIVDEPDEGHQVHWVIYDMPPEARELPGRISFTLETVPGGGKQGRNDFRRKGWAGPCPDPGGKNEGSYLFSVYALDTVLGIDVEGGARRNDVIRAMEGHVIGHGQLMGTFCRTDGLVAHSGSAGKGSCPLLTVPPPSDE